jgi:hypothetical protein
MAKSKSAEPMPPQPPMPCQVCGHEANIHDGSFIMPGETLAFICVYCYANGVLWAAKQAFAREPQTRRKA